MQRILFCKVEMGGNKEEEDRLGIKLNRESEYIDMVIDLLQIAAIREDLTDNGVRENHCCVHLIGGDYFYIDRPYAEVVMLWKALINPDRP